MVWLPFQYISPPPFPPTVKFSTDTLLGKMYSPVLKVPTVTLLAAIVDVVSSTALVP